MRRTHYALIAVLCAAALLASCNLPFLANNDDTASVQTAAALTVQAQLTPAGFATATFTPVPFPTIPAVATTQAPANTLPPAATATSTCDLAQFITDVTIPDGTVMDQGEAFTKTWRLKNIGACTWSGYNLIFDSGDLMSGASPMAIGTVAPGQEVDLSVNLTAPSTDGAYRGYWRIRNPNGVLLPVVSGYQGKSFYVDIKVGTSGGPFAVTHVTYTMSTWNDTGYVNCPRSPPAFPPMAPARSPTTGSGPTARRARPTPWTLTPPPPRPSTMIGRSGRSMLAMRTSSASLSTCPTTRISATRTLRPPAPRLSAFSGTKRPPNASNWQGMSPASSFRLPKPRFRALIFSFSKRL